MPRGLPGAAFWLRGSLTAAAIAFAGYGYFFNSDLCANDIISEYPSPDGQRKLVVFERDCGATTRCSTQASILPIDQALDNGNGNVFIADDNRGAAPSGPGGGPALRVAWRNAHAIQLFYHPNARLFKHEPEHDGVQISYASMSQRPIAAEARNLSGTTKH